jgi:ubiquitin-protein ligase
VAPQGARESGAMITFACGGCGRSFSVPEAFAGRKATCKTCGAQVTVPAAAQPVVAPAQAKVPLRIRRMRSDALQMASAFRNSQFIHVGNPIGDPPDVYTVEYHLRGLERGKKSDQPVVREHHVVEIRLPADYPRLAPKCKMLTPVFHPNIDTTTVCVGDHWVAGERLADLVVRIGEMIAYQAYNLKSPLDAEAAMWADLHATELPIDPRNLHPADV